MSKRVCYNCDNSIPPETEHYIFSDEVYCTDCVDAKPYTSYSYYVDGEYIGCSEEDDSKHVESYDDEYEEDEAS
jgi:hypothetical protein